MFHSYHQRLLSIESITDTGTLDQGYWIVGFEVAPPEVGERWNVMRTVRNGVVKNGLFTTSPVKVVVISSEGYIVETENSTYKARWL